MQKFDKILRIVASIVKTMPFDADTRRIYLRHLSLKLSESLNVISLKTLWIKYKQSCLAD